MFSSLLKKNPFPCLNHSRNIQNARQIFAYSAWRLTGFLCICRGLWPLETQNIALITRYYEKNTFWGTQTRSPPFFKKISGYGPGRLWSTFQLGDIFCIRKKFIRYIIRTSAQSVIIIQLPASKNVNTGPTSHLSRRNRPVESIESDQDQRQWGESKINLQINIWNSTIMDLKIKDAQTAREKKQTRTHSCTTVHSVDIFRIEMPDKLSFVRKAGCVSSTSFVGCRKRVRPGTVVKPVA